VRDLEFVRAGSKFPAIPETSRGFHGKDIHRAGNDANYPSGDIVDSFKAHIDLVKGWQIYSV